MKGIIPRTLKYLAAKPPRSPVPSCAVITMGSGSPLSLAMLTNSFAFFDLAPIINLPTLPRPFVITGVSVAAPAFQARAVNIESAALAIKFVSTSFGLMFSMSEAIASIAATPTVSFNMS